MPIKPENRARYPANWQEVVDAARERTIAANGVDCCEGSPAFSACRAINGQPHPDTGSKVVLTTAHLDHQPENCAPENMRRWCQRCHLAFDAVHHAQTAYATRKSRANTLPLF